MGTERTGKASAAARPLSDSEKLKLGESVWLRGCLVVGETDGLITLEARGTQMTVRAEDVRSKDELDGQLLLEVSPDANIIVRTESLLRAGSGYCNCPATGADPGGAAGTAALRINDNSFPDPFLPNYRCRTEWQQVFVCYWVVIRCKRQRVCYPDWQQVTICWHEGTGGIA
jgi:hypothetical protein